MSNSTFTVNIGAISPWSVAEAFQHSKIAAGSITNETKNVKVVRFKHIHSFKETSSQELHLQTVLTGEVGPNHIEVRGYIPPHDCLFCAMVLMYGEWSNLSWGNGENPVPVLQIGRKTNFILSEIYTCTYNRQTPELKITKNTTWAWQGQKQNY